MCFIKDLLTSQTPVVSFELFPPKTEEGRRRLRQTIADLSRLNPAFISCTYGAGGGNRDKTFEIVQYIQDRHQIPGLAHLTCVLNTKDEIQSILRQAKDRGIQNILALRGDPPADHPNWQPGPNNFRYSCELCAFIRQHFPGQFCVGVAGFPEGHLLCPDRDQDAKYLKTKVQNGADFVITQLFFNNQDYFDYVRRLAAIGVDVPVIPGILPITNYQGLLKFTSLCGASVPPEVREIFEPIADNNAAVMAAGIRFAIQQGKALLKGGAPGLHFYTLNKLHPTEEIVKAIFLSPQSS